MPQGDNTIPNMWKALKEFKARLDEQEKRLQAFTCHFAWYYDSRGKDCRQFAVVKSITGTKANLMVVDSSISGGAEFVKSVELLSDTEKDDDKYDRRWEPILTPKVLNLLLEDADEAATSISTGA